MASIVVVENHSASREFLVQLLRYAGHEVREAADGIDGLARVREERPDLVISDLLMPTMDGFEFVRRLRADPAFVAVPVVFWTASYLEPEARELARAAGVSHLILKPAEPETILSAVNEALGAAAGRILPLSPDLIRAEHLRSISAKLSARVEALSGKIAALADLAVKLAAEQDPDRLLDHLCEGAREVTGSRHAVLGVLERPGGALRLVPSGFPPEMAEDFPTTAEPSGRAAETLNTGRIQRIQDADDPPSELGLPPQHPLVRNGVLVPLRGNRSHGWILVSEPLTGRLYSETDEHVTEALGVIGGRMYETTLRMRELESRLGGPEPAS